MKEIEQYRECADAMFFLLRYVMEMNWIPVNGHIEKQILEAMLKYAEIRMFDVEEISV